VTAPRLVVPDPAPGRPEPKVIVALVAYEYSVRGAPVALSARFTTELFGRRHSTAMSKALRTLRGLDGGGSAWLAFEVETTGGRPHYFVPGPAALRMIDEWIELGRRLFGPEGHLRTLRDRSCTVRGRLGITGLLIARSLEADGPQTSVEVTACLGGLVSRSTVWKRLTALLDAGLATKDGRRYMVVDDFESELVRYELDSGAALLKDRTVRNHAMERERHFSAEAYARQADEVRALPCTVAGCRTGAPIEVDHFPSIASGGFDDPAHMFPVCREHHELLSIRTRSLPKRPTPAPVGKTIPFPGDDALGFFADVLEFLHLDLYIGARDLPWTQAKLDHVYVTWAALHGHGHDNRIVDTITGEVTAIKPERHRITQRGRPYRR